MNILRIFHNQDITMEKAWPPPAQSSKSWNKTSENFLKGHVEEVRPFCHLELHWKYLSPIIGAF